MMQMFSQKTITMEHGAGGQFMQELISDIILKNITNRSAGTVGLDSLDDGSTISIPEGLEDGAELVMTTDSHVVDPLFFPGGDIGKLAVCGTVNDLAVMGAKPLALTCAIILPEGFELSVLGGDQVHEPCSRGGRGCYRHRRYQNHSGQQTGFNGNQHYRSGNCS
jgi:hydrogenase expression/formation protein HypE